MMNPANILSGNFKVLLVGCGEMGSAMLQAWLSRGLSNKRIVVVEPKQEHRVAFEDYKIKFVDDRKQISPDFIPDVIFFAVRPQRMSDVVPEYVDYARFNPVFISIAAGCTISFFSSILGNNTEIVRAMPNSPAQVMRGVTVANANINVSEDRRLQSSALLESVGEVIWIRDEKLMDAVTALSGSGPAYVFHLVESMAAAGVNAGLPEYLSMRLARATVCGAGELLYQTSETAVDLRKKVTTEGGTTAAAFKVLLNENQGMVSLMSDAIAAAANRSCELANNKN